MNAFAIIDEKDVERITNSSSNFNDYSKNNNNNFMFVGWSRE